MIIESHAHYSHIKFDQTFPCLTYDDGKFAVENGDREGLLARVREKGVIGVVEPAIGIGSNENVLKLAGEFTEQDIERIRSGFSKVLGRDIRFKVVRDESLIGGFSAFINGKVYDASILARVDDMRRQFND